VWGSERKREGGQERPGVRVEVGVAVWLEEGVEVDVWLEEGVTLQESETELLGVPEELLVRLGVWLI
jgi:hypothetical protein